MPKRKAVASPSSEEDSPPKTARQKREEAKARAREWAEREANKKTAAPSKVKSTPTRKKTTPAKKTRRTPSKKATPVKSPEPAKKKQKLNSGKVKLSKKQQIAEAKARAQEWADKQKQVDEEKMQKTSAPKGKKPITSPKKSPAAQASPAATAAAAKSPSSAAASRVADAAARGPYGAAVEMDATANTAQAQLNIMRAQEQQAMARAQAENNAWAFRMQQMSPEQQQQFYHNQAMQNSAMAMYGQPAWGYAPQANYAYNGSYPPVASPPMNAPVASPSLRGTAQNANASPYLGSPPPQVNAAPKPATATTAATTKAKSPTRPRRAAAKKKAPAPAPVPAPAVSPPYEIPPEEGDDVAVVQQDDVELEGTSASSKGFQFFSVSLKVLILPVIVAIAAYFAFIHPEALESTTSLEPVKPPCFLADPTQAAALFNCDKSKGVLPCPQGGVCSRGQLASCIDPRMAVAETLDRCVVSAETNETLAKVEALLSEWTIEQTCSLTGAAHPINNPDSRAPFFDVSLVQEQIDVSYDTLALSDSFALVSGSGESLIGLTDDYVDNKLIVPFWCYCGLLTFAALETIVAMVLYVATLITEVFWNMTVAFPLVSVSFFFILWAAYAIRKKRKERTQLRQEVATVRDLTYDKLYEDRKTDHYVLHLRDGVAMDMYPTSKTKRSYIINTVWPRVVADVKQDNRVLKSTKMLLGTPRDVWQWTASSTPGKKRN